MPLTVSPLSRRGKSNLEIGKMISVYMQEDLVESQCEMSNCQGQESSLKKSIINSPKILVAHLEKGMINKRVKFSIPVKDLKIPTESK